MTSPASADRATALTWWVALIPLAALLVYWNSLSAPFIFDDSPGIVQNASAHRLWPLSIPLQPPNDGSSVTGRPVINLSLAINYAIGGLDVRGYHFTNLLLHALGGLILYGIVRRTLLQLTLIDAYGESASALALIVALLWTVHPLQTETVTCVIQRTELLMGLFYLLTLYAFIRSVEFSPGPPEQAEADELTNAGEIAASSPALASSEPLQLRRGWQAISVTACLLGMASKEVMVTAPLLVLLYDWIFISGRWRELWRRHGGYYAALAATWILLGWLVIKSGGDRGGSVSAQQEISPWSYLLTQSDAITRYLKLSFLPTPLILDYGTPVETSLANVWQESLLVLGLLVTSVVALIRRSPLGLLGAWFFLILAPSSSVLPLLTQTMAEHRMYLPLAAVLIVIVLAIYHGAGRWMKPALGLLILGCCVMTWFRNEDYRSKLGIWRDTVNKRPDNARAWYNYGHELFDANKVHEAIDAYNESVRLDPKRGRAQAGLAAALDAAGRFEEALPHAQEGVKLAPNYTSAFITLGLVLVDLGRPEPALQAFKAAIALNAEATSSFHAANVLFRLNRYPEAENYYRQSLALDPTQAMAHFNFGVTLAAMHRDREALAELERALHLQPEIPDGRTALQEVRQRLKLPPLNPAPIAAPRASAK